MPGPDGVRMASKARDVYPQQGGSFQFCKRLPGRVSWYLFLRCNLVKIVGVDHVSTGDVDICMYVHILIIYIYIKGDSMGSTTNYHQSWIRFD